MGLPDRISSGDSQPLGYFFDPLENENNMDKIYYIRYMKLAYIVARLIIDDEDHNLTEERRKMYESNFLIITGKTWDELKQMFKE